MTTPTNVYNRNTGPVQRAQGYVTATSALSTDALATDANAVFTPTTLTLKFGFVPTRFKWFNVTAHTMFEWVAGMPSGYTMTTDSGGTQTLNTGSTILVALRTGTGAVGGTSSGGSADTTPLGVVTVTFSGLLTNSETACWICEG